MWAESSARASLDAAAVVAPLAELAPDLCSTDTPLPRGQLVLLRPGIYVNRGTAMGLDCETSPQDLELLEGCLNELE